VQVVLCDLEIADWRRADVGGNGGWLVSVGYGPSGSDR
jgi:hypothetical protein